MKETRRTSKNRRRSSPGAHSTRGSCARPAAARPQPGLSGGTLRPGAGGPWGVHSAQKHHHECPRYTITNATGTGRGETAQDGGRWRQQKAQAGALGEEGVLEETGGSQTHSHLDYKF